jgi:hypothetical protein
MAVRGDTPWPSAGRTHGRFRGHSPAVYREILVALDMAGGRFRVVVAVMLGAIFFLAYRSLSLSAPGRLIDAARLRGSADAAADVCGCSCWWSLSRQATVLLLSTAL